jgi:hypothetical protein
MIWQWRSPPPDHILVDEYQGVNRLQAATGGTGEYFPRTSPLSASGFPSIIRDKPSTSFLLGGRVGRHRSLPCLGGACRRSHRQLINHPKAQDGAGPAGRGLGRWAAFSGRYRGSWRLRLGSRPCSSIGFSSRSGERSVANLGARPRVARRSSHGTGSPDAPYRRGEGQQRSDCCREPGE